MLHMQENLGFESHTGDEILWRISWFSSVPLTKRENFSVHNRIPSRFFSIYHTYSYHLTVYNPHAVYKACHNGTHTPRDGSVWILWKANTPTSKFSVMVPFHLCETVTHDQYFKVIPLPATSAHEVYTEQKPTHPLVPTLLIGGVARSPALAMHSLCKFYCSVLYEAKAKPLHLAW
jgi:hypothetical protein